MDLKAAERSLHASACVERLAADELDALMADAAAANKKVSAWLATHSAQYAANVEAIEALRAKLIPPNASDGWACSRTGIRRRTTHRRMQMGQPQSLWRQQNDPARELRPGCQSCCRRRGRPPWRPDRLRPPPRPLRQLRHVPLRRVPVAARIDEARGGGGGGSDGGGGYSDIKEEAKLLGGTAKRERE